MGRNLQEKPSNQLYLIKIYNFGIFWMFAGRKMHLAPTWGPQAVCLRPLAQSLLKSSTSVQPVTITDDAHDTMEHILYQRLSFVNTVKPMYNDHLQDTKYMDVVCRWSLFTSSFLKKKFKIGPQNGGQWRQVVVNSGLTVPIKSLVIAISCLVSKP